MSGLHWYQILALGLMRKDPNRWLKVAIMRF